MASSALFLRQPSWLPSPGTAVRHCDEHRGWLPPNLFNCTSLTFSELKGFVSEPPHGHLLAPFPCPVSLGPPNFEKAILGFKLLPPEAPTRRGHFSPWLRPLHSSSALLGPLCHRPALTFPPFWI